MLSCVKIDPSGSVRGKVEQIKSDLIFFFTEIQNIKQQQQLQLPCTTEKWTFDTNPLLRGVVSPQSFTPVFIALTKTKTTNVR